MLKRNAAVLARSGETVSVGDVTDRISWESGGISVGDATARQIVVEGLLTTLSATALSLQRGNVVDDYFGMGVDSAELAPRQGGLAKLIHSAGAVVGFCDGRGAAAGDDRD